jgi:hypothetical protein
MKKIFLFTLMGISMFLVSCQKETVDTITPIPHVENVEKVFCRTNSPIKIIGCDFLYYKDFATGSIKTNHWGAIHVQFKTRGKSARVRVEEEVLMVNPIFAQGGNIVVELLSEDNEVVDTHRIWFDIVDTEENIMAWGRKINRL